MFSSWAYQLLDVRHYILVPTAYLLFHQNGTGRGWLSQLRHWLWPSLQEYSFFAAYIHPAADFRHHWTHLQMNSEIILFSPVVVTELNKHHWDQPFSLTTVPGATGGREKKIIKAWLAPFSNLGLIWGCGIQMEKSVKNDYKGMCLQTQTSTNWNNGLWHYLKLRDSCDYLESWYRTWVKALHIYHNPQQEQGEWKWLG